MIAFLALGISAQAANYDWVTQDVTITSPALTNSIALPSHVAGHAIVHVSVTVPALTGSETADIALATTTTATTGKFWEKTGMTKATRTNPMALANAPAGIIGLDRTANYWIVDQSAAIATAQTFTIEYCVDLDIDTDVIATTVSIADGKTSGSTVLPVQADGNELLTAFVDVPNLASSNTVTVWLANTYLGGTAMLKKASIAESAETAILTSTELPLGKMAVSMQSGDTPTWAVLSSGTESTGVDLVVSYGVKMSD